MTVHLKAKEEKQLYPNSCESFAFVTLDYSIETGSLVVYYNCIEACAEKYRKIQ